jgi:hypothetical protein
MDFEMIEDLRIQIDDRIHEDRRIGLGMKDERQNQADDLIRVDDRRIGLGMIEGR